MSHCDKKFPLMVNKEITMEINRTSVSTARQKKYYYYYYYLREGEEGTFMFPEPLTERGVIGENPPLRKSNRK